MRNFHLRRHERLLSIRLAVHLEKLGRQLGLGVELMVILRLSNHRLLLKLLLLRRVLLLILRHLHVGR